MDLSDILHILFLAIMALGSDVIWLWEFSTSRRTHALSQGKPGTAFQHPCSQHVLIWLAAPYLTRAHHFSLEIPFKRKTNQITRVMLEGFLTFDPISLDRSGIIGFSMNGLSSTYKNWKGESHTQWFVYWRVDLICARNLRIFSADLTSCTIR